MTSSLELPVMQDVYGQTHNPLPIPYLKLTDVIYMYVKTKRQTCVIMYTPL